MKTAATNPSIFRFCLSLSSFVLALFLAGLAPAVQAQNYGATDRYLIDSLDLEKLAPAEAKLLDTCMQWYHASDSDTSRMQALMFLIENSWDETVWPRYNDLLYDIATSKLAINPPKELRRHYKKAKANALNNYGYYAQVHLANIDSALVLFHQSLAIWEELGDSAQIMVAYNNMGANYRDQGNIPVALEYHHKTLRYLERNGGDFSTAYALTNLATIYMEQDDRPMALKYHKRALKLRQKIEDQLGIASSLTNIAALLNLQGKRDSALNYYETALDIYLELGHKQSLGTAYNNLGTIMVQEGEDEKAQAYFEQSISMSEQAGDKVGLSKTLKNVASIHWRKGEVTEARSLAERGLKLAQEAGNVLAIRVNASLLAEIAKQQQDFDAALTYRNLEIQMRDSLASAKAMKATARLEAQYAYQQKSAADKALIAEQELAISQNRLQRFLLIGGVLILLLLAGILIQRLRLSKIKHELDQKKKQLDLSMVISDNKVRYDFNQQLITNLEALKEVEVHQLKSQINRYIVDLKNQLNFEEKQNYLSDNIETLHSNFEDQLKARFPDLSPSEIEICHMFRLNMSIKEIANLKNTSEGAIRTARYRIKTKLKLDKDQSLDTYIKESV